MTLRLNGDSSGFTEIKAADAAGDNSIKLPASNGSAYQLLRNGTSAGELAYESDLRVDGTGNVGIGRDPVYSGVFGGSQRVLHIGGTAAPGIRITSDTADQADFVIQAGNSGRATYIASLAENGDIVYFTRPTGGSLTERFRIKGGGQIALSANCPGIDFSGIQTNAAGMSSETLDGYEEGTWTPVLTDASEQATWSFNYNSANYTKVGRLVTVSANCFSIGYSGTPSNYLQIRGLPFTKVAGAFPSGSVKVQNVAFGADSYLTVEFVTSSATNYAYFRVSTNNGGGNDLMPTSLSNGTAGFTFSITYEIA